jgi:hypothetical protein
VKTVDKERLNKIKNILFEQIKRISDGNYEDNDLKKEVSKSNTLTNTALTYIKASNLELRIVEMEQKAKEDLLK